LRTVSPGEDLLERLKKEELDNTKKIPDDYNSKIIGGVEVVDVKAVPKKNTEKTKTDKFGIPEPKDRRTWDRI
jgi:hypothetical protein